MDYESVRSFAATWGLVALVIMFLVAVAYALWPRNRARFRDAAHMPLRED
ncbi:MAG: cbb3-type cytochrome c oxidase subunit 3 [Alphaproteobacteria bacterium]|nr:cbb3-type cytochrome c oxidase subunit 3 [Alphaproteobacteria bacterium]MCY4320021.1 cbb3-type cytochrome c oxidase subunit 3 [Alphaproteobacteria bacterium]